MSRNMRKVDVPARTEDRWIGTTCDICGEQTTKADDDWAEGHWEYSRVTVEYRHGGDGEETDCQQFDICPDCFEDKLTPWMVSHGRVTEARTK